MFFFEAFRSTRNSRADTCVAYYLGKLNTLQTTKVDKKFSFNYIIFASTVPTSVNGDLLCKVKHNTAINFALYFSGHA
jgi:hypothetical protein